MIKISIYNANQFTVKGRLKKNAKAEYCNEAETIDKGKEADNIKAMGYRGFETPYFFTHIKALNKDGQAVRIFQDVMVSGQWLITSPTQLLINLV